MTKPVVKTITVVRSYAGDGSLLDERTTTVETATPAADAGAPVGMYL